MPDCPGLEAIGCLAVVGIPLISQARSWGCVGRWLRRVKTPACVTAAWGSITVCGVALLASKNL